MIAFLLAALAAPVVIHAPDRASCAAAPEMPNADYGVHPLDNFHRDQMRGVSWHQGCPVELDDLALVIVPYVDDQCQAHAGEIVVAKRVAPSVDRIFKKLFSAHYPIAQMRPVEGFDGDDIKSMSANNTAGFNCRPGSDPRDFSRHAYGDAIDLNPLWNPQVKETIIKPPNATKWLDRAKVRPGMNVRGGTAVKIFRAEGWRWGGLWTKPRDYQHFSPLLSDSKHKDLPPKSLHKIRSP